MDIVDKFSVAIIQPVVAFIVALGLVFFLYGVMEYILGSDNSEQRTKGAKHMVWGIIGLAIMVMVWGIIGVIKSTIGA
jgi:uncharacterized membrane protein YidH (DUF202 family)